MRRAALSVAALCAISTSAYALDLGPAPQFVETDMARVKLGQLLFYDPILSGNQNISCATCHHPKFGTSDGVSLSLGEGAIGLGPDRHATAQNTPEQRLPRNAPALFNLGATEFQVMFHDGRLEADATQPNGIRTPLGSEMTLGFDSVLSAQAMFPVLSGDEMAGHYSENPVSQSVRLGQLSTPGGAWDKIAARVADIPAYRAAFDQVLGTDTPIGFTDISNVVADFIRFEWRADQSDFDRFLTEGTALSAEAAAGMNLFYGKANCSSCHSGWFQTDHGFHSIALPQIGPGKAARFETHAKDEGRMRVTGDPADAYRFRTPSLRNVAATAPYGHNGAYATLDGIVRHHLAPQASLMAYDEAQAVLPGLDGTKDFKVTHDAAELARIAASSDLQAIALSDQEVAEIVAFLHALSDDAWRYDRLGVPETVPSGLAVDR